MRTELGSWRRAWRRVGKVGKAEVEVEEAEARRRARRTASRGGGGRRRRRACALIKSNNPHLAGGEQKQNKKKKRTQHAKKKNKTKKQKLRKMQVLLFFVFSGDSSCLGFLIYLLKSTFAVPHGVIMLYFFHIEIDQAPLGAAAGTETRHAALQSAPPKRGTDRHGFSW